MKCPCENCLCVPMCRHKEYHKLAECSLMKEYLLGHPCTASLRPPRRVFEIETILNPVVWKCFIKNEEPDLVFIHRKGDKFKG